MGIFIYLLDEDTPFMPLSRTRVRAAPLQNSGQLFLFDGLLPVHVPALSLATEALPPTLFSAHFLPGFSPSADGPARGTMGRIRVNLLAIETLRDIQQDNRTATEAEKEQLSQFSGWGGAASVWDETNYGALLESGQTGRPLASTMLEWAATFGPLRHRLGELLTPTEEHTAKESVLSAYFTPPAVVRAIWKAIERMGYTGGKMLEPGVGMGAFIGYMPPHLRAASAITAIEKDELTAQLVGVCYPEITLHAAAYEDTELAADFDLVIGNVPFGGFSVYDRQHRDLSRQKVHNYFLGKSARLLRPGGLMALITTSGTLDSETDTFRQWLYDQQMGLAGAIRLPGNAFGGTQVTTDVLFFQKGNGVETLFSQHPYARLTTVHSEADPSGETVDEMPVNRHIRINEYFAQRPAQVIGQMQFADESGQGGAYRANRTTCFLADLSALETRLRTAIDGLPHGIVAEALPGPFAPPQPIVDTLADVIRLRGKAYTKRRVLTDYNDVKEALRLLWQAERDERHGEEATTQLRQQLRREYTTFVGQYGSLTANRGLKWIELIDAQFATVQALEQPQRDAMGKRIYVPSAILTRRVFPLSPRPQQATSVADAVAIVESYYGHIDVTQVAALLNAKRAEVLARLLAGQYMYLDPLTHRPLPRSLYLSGNVREKLAQAEEAAATDPRFGVNVRALTEQVPARVPAHLIQFTLGTVWLPVEAIAAFMAQQFELPRVRIEYNEAATTYEWVNGEWSDYSHRNRAEGTAHRLGTQLVEAALNARTLVITKTVHDAEGNEKQVRDVEATSAAVMAQERLIELFIDFARQHYGPAIEATFNDLYTSHVPRVYAAPSFDCYPGATPTIRLRQHQQQGVSRILVQDCLLAHSVGSGKTYIMITAAMELRRLGIARKAMLVVQNSTVADFTVAFRALYPAALLCVPEPADMEAKNRAAFLRRIATNEFDAVILPQSFLKRIPDELAACEAFIQEEIARVQASIALEGRRNRSAKRSMKKLAELEARIWARRKRQADRSLDHVPTFDELGIGALFLDEAHRYKRLGFFTKRAQIKGIDTQGSEDAFSALMKCRTIQARRGRVVLATGTPISNTMAEAWTMLRFIATSRLEKARIRVFDEFAAAFGQVISSFELTTTGNFKAVDRFAKFVNVKALSDLYRSHVDVVLSGDIAEFKRDNTLPQLVNGEFTRIILAQTDGVAEEMARIREELIAFDRMSGAEKRENSHIPLVMFGQARKATLDIRLIDPSNPDEAGSKVNRAITEICRLARQSETYRGTQLVFSDLYQSPATEVHADFVTGTFMTRKATNRFNLFEDMRAKLIAAGFAPEQVAITPDDADKREAVFASVRTGEIRVLFGSSERMGVGVNVQERVIGLHHLDAPARPTDFEQRNGRAIRQGNLHAEMNVPIEVLTYGVDRTMDATAYGRLAIKQRFIHQVLKGEVTDEQMADVSADDDFASLSFDQMMATLSGSQYAILLATKNLALQRLTQQKKNFDQGVLEATNTVHRARLEWRRQEMALPHIEQQASALQAAFMKEGAVNIDSLRMGSEVTTEDMGKKVLGLMNTLHAQARRDSKGVASSIVGVNSMPITVTAYRMQGTGECLFQYSYGQVLKGEFSKAAGFMLSLRVRLEEVPYAAAACRTQIAYYQAQEASFTDKANGIFAKQPQIDALTVEISEIKRTMEAEATPQP